jgi:hypothetical protein
MRIMQIAMWTFFAANLAAQGSDQGFKWGGLRAGSISFDPKENVNAAPFFGGQVGMVFDQRRYGLSLEGLIARPKSNLSPGQSLSHSEVSVTLLTGLSADSSSRFWPYLGLGLGAVSVPKVSLPTLASSTNTGGTAHASLGLLHRPDLGFIWGAEARYLLTFTPKDLREIQGSAMVGFTWGGRQATRRAEAYAPPASPAVTPPVPLPVVVVVPPQPAAPLPVVEAAPPAPVRAPAPPPVVVAPPPPAPLPVAAVAAPAAPIPVPVKRGPSTQDSAAAGSTLTARLDALLLGDMTKAVELGRKRIEAIPAHGWTIRLEIANLPSTLKHAVGAFPGREPDLFIAPIKLRGGKIAYQLFLGEYASKAEAERAARTVPSLFLEGGQRPRPFLVTGIPTQVNP